jgi:hypothetical protein
MQVHAERNDTTQTRSKRFDFESTLLVVSTCASGIPFGLLESRQGIAMALL